MRSKELSQVEHPELPLARKADAVQVPLELVLKQPTFAAAIALCVQVSGLEEKEVYLSLEIDAGHWTRIMKGGFYGRLNPAWTEWLMGWPIGWTASEPLATDKIQEWWRTHGGCCAEPSNTR